MKRPSKQQCKRLRIAFREAVLERDGNVCRMCGAGPPLDAHHIAPRKEMPNDGYAVENGIALCKPCHEKAEAYLQAVKTADEFTFGLYPIVGPEVPYAPDRLYEAIGTDHGIAVQACERLL